MPEASRLKNGTDIVQAVLTCVAIVVGGVWALLQFGWHREAYPHLTLDQTISHRALPIEKTLLIVDVSLKNDGHVLLNPIDGYVTVNQILPLGDKARALLAPTRETYVKEGQEAIDWANLIGARIENRSRFLEPDESDQLHYEFIFPSTVCTVIVNSFFKNPKLSSPSNEIGWERATIYDVRPPADCSKPDNKASVLSHQPSTAHNDLLRFSKTDKSQMRKHAVR